MEIPHYPEMAPIDLSFREELHPHLSLLQDGVSEFTFAGLYLFRATYDYHLSMVDQEKLLVRGFKNGREFCSLPCGLPSNDGSLRSLLDRFDYLKGIGESQADAARIRVERYGYEMREDRDNFDYLYLKDELAELPGKRFHKKRNHVNAFLRTYTFREEFLSPDLVPDALAVLEEWQSTREDRADYAAAREALERFGELELKGHIVYVDERPAAYAVGEPLMKGRSFVVHFEKALDEYRGLYQYINKAFAQALPAHYTWINREQDLGDEGLRQSKMTYRPVGFVKKYVAGRNLPVPAASGNTEQDGERLERADQESA